jgi:hypothetical protein
MSRALTFFPPGPRSAGMIRGVHNADYEIILALTFLIIAATNAFHLLTTFCFPLANLAPRNTALGVCLKADPAKGGGGEVLIFEWGKAEKGKTKGKLLLTKLLLPRHQVTLSQIPPSQKEMWGAESKPHFPACPHANSSCTSVACEPAGG